MEINRLLRCLEMDQIHIDMTDFSKRPPSHVAKQNSLGVRAPQKGVEFGKIEAMLLIIPFNAYCKDPSPGRED